LDAAPGRRAVPPALFDPVARAHGGRRHGDDPDRDPVRVLPALLRRRHRRVGSQGMSGPTTGRMDVDANDGATSAPTTPPRPPSLAGALRLAARDVYANSWRIVPWNLLWAA